MRYPTRKALEAELAALTIAHPGSTIATLVAAIARDRAGTVGADGYATRTPGAGDPGGGSRGSSSTETAALARVNAKTERDLVHENLEQALGYLDQALGSIRAFQHRVSNLVDIMGPPKPPMCEVLVGTDSIHFSDVGGRLHRKHHLSQPAYDFVLTRDRLPDEAEREEYRRYGTWIRRVRT